MRRICLVLLASLFSAHLIAATPPAEQWIVVTAPAFRPALDPLIKARKDQGMQVAVIEKDVLSVAQLRRGEADKLRERIHQLCKKHPGRSSILLVGAIEAGRGEQAEQIVMPPLVGSIGRMKGEPSDNGYGCLQAGRLPSVAVGRFPVRTLAEARALVARTLAYEANSEVGWERRLTILAGIPAYNPVVDKLVENMALARFARLAPDWRGKALYTHPQSRFCVPEALVKKTALRYLEEGSAITLYLGHSNPQGLYAGDVPFLDRRDFAGLKKAGAAGVFLTFGCNGCQLKGPDGEGYGVTAVRNPNGPVAVLGSHGICFAAMVQLATDRLFHRAFEKDLPERLGSLWLAVQEGVAEGTLDPFTYAMLDAVDGDRRIPQNVQRQEHLEMFVLLGDPALRLPRKPSSLPLEVGPVVLARRVAIKGTAPAALEGRKVQVSLERAVNSMPVDLETLPGERGAARDEVMLRNHERANNFVVASGEASVRDGRFVLELTVPAKMPGGVVIVRARAVKDRDEWVGVLQLKVSEAP